MDKPIIGIIGRCNISPNEKDVMHVIDEYRRAVIIAGGIPIVILPTKNSHYTLDREITTPKMVESEKQDLIKELELCNGIILPGGCRIFDYDEFVCEYTIKNNIPLLGICLGMQTMAAVDCKPNKVVEYINNGVDHRKEDKFVHDVKIDKSSFLYSILKNDKFKVNSFHKCNVIDTNKFDIVGYSDDNLIEAIELKENTFTIGVQWHPERIIDESIESKRLFEKFIDISKNNNKYKK